MKKKIMLLSGTILLMLIIAMVIPVVGEVEERGFLGRVHIRAIGNNFHICDDDGGVYGHIFIGLKGMQLVFNEDIVIPEESIRWVVMTKHILNCVYREL